MADSNAGLEARRSKVRVRVTYAATLFVFAGGPLLIVALLWRKDVESAKSVFTAILPVASGVIAYWFGTRRPAESDRTLTTQVANGGAEQNDFTDQPGN